MAKTDIIIPTKCPACGAKLIKNGPFLECPNEDCSDVKLHRIEKWVKKADIYELGGATIKALFDAGVIAYPSDLYKMVAKDIQPITGGTRSAEKIVNEIASKKEVSLAVFVGGLDIDGFGETLTSTIMSAGFDTLEKIQKAKVSELEAIKGIGSITAKILKDGLKANDSEIKNLLKVVTITAPKAAVKGGALDGMSFCFTGALTIKRAVAEDMVVAKGGKIAGVSKTLTYLVTPDPDSGSAKNVKAAALGIKVIDEATFMDMIK
jgi:DNA ligase (NAD+)